MKIRTDFVTNSSCACFVCYQNDSEELAKALLKCLFESNGLQTTIYGNAGEYFEISESGIYAQYQDMYASCSFLDQCGGEVKYCPNYFEADVRLKGMLDYFFKNKKYIFDDGEKHTNYVETTDGKLYNSDQVKYVEFELSFNQNVFDNLEHYSREQIGETLEDGMEHLKFSYPSLAKAILLDIQQKDIDEWKEKFETFEISINNENEFSGMFGVKTKCNYYDQSIHAKSVEYIRNYILHVWNDGVIEISSSIKLYNKRHLLYLEYDWDDPYLGFGEDEKFDCWNQTSCHECRRICPKYGSNKEYCDFDYELVYDFHDKDYDYVYSKDDEYALENITLCYLLKLFDICPKNVSNILKDGTVTSEAYRAVNGKLFLPKSQEVKPIGHVIDMIIEALKQELPVYEIFCIETDELEETILKEDLQVFIDDNDFIEYDGYLYSKDDAGNRDEKLYYYKMQYKSVDWLIAETEENYDYNSYRECGSTD